MTVPGAVAGWMPWGANEAAEWIAVPGPHDDKYSRGVLGMLTGSQEYPGAAVLGVEAAMRTGVGMVRYLGAKRPSRLVLQRRPEVVTAAGRVQAWLAGSGTDPKRRSREASARLAAALEEALPTVLDAGALDQLQAVRGPAVITPHYRELSGVLEQSGTAVDASEIAAAPALWAARAAEQLGVTVLLKGDTTYVAGPAGERFTVSTGTNWLATAGTGDVLGGVLGALAATHSDRILDEPPALARIAASAAALHGLAATRAATGGPIAALDVAEAMPATVAELLRARV